MFIFLSCFSRFVRPCYYAPEKGKKVPRKNFLPLSPVQISFVTPSFDKISELGKRKILPANHANVRETQTRLDLSIHSRPLACLVGKTFPRFGCIALCAYLFSATGAGSFKSATGRIRRGEPGATPQGNVAREGERCKRESATVQMNRAFSAGRGLFTGEPGALPQAHVTIAPLALSRYFAQRRAYNSAKNFASCARTA